MNSILVKTNKITFLNDLENLVIAYKNSKKQVADSSYQLGSFM